RPKAASRSQDRPRQHRTHHEEIAVSDVDDVKQAEDDRESERDQGDDQAPDQPVGGEQKQLVHVGVSGQSGEALPKLVWFIIHPSIAGASISPDMMMPTPGIGN